MSTLTPAQLEKRLLSFGSSEIGAVCGVSPHSSVLDVWREKVTGERKVVPERVDECAEWGDLLEPVIRQKYRVSLPTGYKVSPAPGVFTHRKYEWATASPDGLVKGFTDYTSGFLPEILWGLECKNRSHTEKPRWKGRVPCDTAAQSQWGMFVTDLERWDVARLINGNDYKVETLERDDELLGAMTAVGLLVWGAVQAKMEPEMGWVDRELQLIRAKLVNEQDEAAFRRAEYWRKRDSKGE